MIFIIESLHFLANKTDGTMQSNPELIQTEMGKIVEYFAESINNFSGTSLAAQNLNEMKKANIFSEDGIILIKGAVPGSKGTLLVIRDAIKPKSLMVKVKKEEISEEPSKKDKKVEASDAGSEKQNDQKPKEEKK